MSKLEEGFLKKGLDNNYKIRRFVPLRYQDFSRETGCIEGEAVCVGIMVSCERLRSASGTDYIQIRIKDRITDQIFKVCIFNQPYAFNNYFQMTGKWVLVSGTMHYGYGSYSIAGPAILTDEVAESMKITPVYPRVGTAKPFYVKKKIHETSLEVEDETIPKETLVSQALPGISWSLYEMHHPSSIETLKQADKRLLTDDLFYFAACNELNERGTKSEGAVLSDNTLCETIKERFGFPLTADQAKTYEEISQKTMSGQRIRALVQGDVGCGKTIVAFLLAAQAVSSGFQAVIMAPTVILAEQHYNKLKDLLPEYEDKIFFAGGKKPLKKDLTKIKNGTYRFLVGTHSLLSDNIQYENVGLVVIDEEHKFGVEQRKKLEEITSNVHCISMSATPIPRTLASALYGSHIDVYSIKTMPAGRKPVLTIYDDGTDLRKYIEYILSQDQQIYIVCPAIDNEDEKMPGVLSVKDAYEKYSAMFPNIPMAMLNGKMSAAQTQETLQNFKNNQIKVLISTTVVEVGVDVPNATLIIIQNAERFGLAGMHQLRGRVGRGDKQSYCILVSKNSNERIEALCKSGDGFEIAQADLDLRKSGAIFGTEQSGFNVITEEVLNNIDYYNILREEVKNYSKIILNRHIKKAEECYNPKRRNLYGNGGRIYALSV